MTEARIFRYEVPVDDRWHPLDVPDPCQIVQVGCRRRDVVEFWAISVGSTWPRQFRVVGTGQPFDLNEDVYKGTAVVPEGDLVWHLTERYEQR